MMNILSKRIIFSFLPSAHCLNSCFPRYSTSLIGFLTDVEGDLPFLLRYAQMSQVIMAINMNDHWKLQFRPCDIGINSFFVFGGDVFDNGPGDIQVARLLLDFKMRYPDRVHLLLGNRDINKMRLSSELAQCDLRRSPNEIELPAYASASPKAVFFPEFLTKLTKTSKSWKHIPSSDYKNIAINTPSNRLKWILSYTMGAPRAFEYRRKELAFLNKIKIEQLTDDEVVASFVSSVQEGGFVREYIKKAQLAVCINDTLFVHGAAHDSIAGFIPKSKNQPCTSPHQNFDWEKEPQMWIERLNTWCKEEIQQWEEFPHFDLTRRNRGGETLMEYAVPGGCAGHSCVYNTWLGSNKCIKSISTDVRSYFQKNGIHRIVSGHRPNGDCPSVFRQDNFSVITADTCYSDEEAKDKRGLAVSEVVITQKNGIGTARIHGTLKTGEKINWIVDDDPFIGSLTIKKRWVKCLLANKDDYILCSPGPTPWPSDLIYSRESGRTLRKYKEKHSCR